MENRSRVIFVYGDVMGYQEKGGSEGVVIDWNDRCGCNSDMAAASALV